MLNKNIKILKNMALRIDIVLVFVTIILPLMLIGAKVEVNIEIVPLFILLFLLFTYIDKNAHKLYIEKGENKAYKQIEREKNFLKGNKEKAILYGIILIATMIVLFFIGNQLSISLEQLCITFGLPELLLGVVLGFSTSIPELITFFEAQKHYKKDKNEELGVIEATNNLLSSNLLCLFIIQSIGIVIYNIAK